MLQNEPLVAIVAVHTVENEPLKVLRMISFIISILSLVLNHQAGQRSMSPSGQGVPDGVASSVSGATGIQARKRFDGPVSRPSVRPKEKDTPLFRRLLLGCINADFGDYGK